MVQTERDATSMPRRPPWPARRPAVPPWLISVALHGVLIVAVGLALRSVPPTGAAPVRSAEVGIALKQQDGQKEFFISEADAGRADSVSPKVAGSVSREQLLSDAALRDPSEVLPSVPKVLGVGTLGVEGVGDATAATSGSSGRGSLGRGKARVRVFGTEGHGYKFVYVFDRSGSMGGSGRNALRAAKNELLGSLDSLQRNHQFQIVFYNQKPWQFNPSGRPGQLAFGTDRNKELARRFIGSITADGATRHEEALRLAIRMRPDVIFFLTDADEPRLSSEQIRRIARAAAGITINAIEFGYGPQQDKDTFLARLARSCGGQYGYIDVSQFKPD